MTPTQQRKSFECSLKFRSDNLEREHSPPLRGGVAATPIRYREATLIGADGVVSWAKKRPCRSDHPVCAASVASQHCYWRSHPSSARRGMLRLIWYHPEFPTKEDIRDELRDLNLTTPASPIHDRRQSLYC